MTRFVATQLILLQFLTIFRQPWSLRPMESSCRSPDLNTCNIVVSAKIHPRTTMWRWCYSSITHDRLRANLSPTPSSNQGPFGCLPPHLLSPWISQHKKHSSTQTRSYCWPLGSNSKQCSCKVNLLITVLSVPLVVLHSVESPSLAVRLESYIGVYYCCRINPRSALMAQNLALLNKPYTDWLFLSANIVHDRTRRPQPLPRWFSTYRRWWHTFSLIITICFDCGAKKCQLNITRGYISVGRTPHSPPPPHTLTRIRWQHNALRTSHAERMKREGFSVCLLFF